MALENPLPPRPIRESRGVGQAGLKRYVRSSFDGLNMLENGQEEGTFRSSSKIDMKQLVSIGKVNRFALSCVVQRVYNC
jgi:hypothetical protein